MKFIDIGEISERSGVPPSTLRYYEEIGLIASIGRHGLRRQYEPRVLLQLSLITLGKAAGFSLEEIASIFGANGELNLPRAELHAKADDLQRQIRNLTTLQNALRHVADCPAPSHLECATFQKMLRLGTAKAVAEKVGKVNTSRLKRK